MIPHCWHGVEEENDPALLEEYPDGATCMLLQGHEGPHEYVDNREIVVEFPEKRGTTMICPEDFKPCMDDLCQGGCIRLPGVQPYHHCPGGCGALVSDEDRDDCTCEPEYEDEDYCEEDVS